MQKKVRKYQKKVRKCKQRKKTTEKRKKKKVGQEVTETDEILTMCNNTLREKVWSWT